LDLLKKDSDPMTVAPDWVTATAFFAVHERDELIIGMVSIRQVLNIFLRDVDDIIGFGVRPSERGKGHSSQMLSIALDHCRDIGLDRVMLACLKENEAPRRTIIGSGGGLDVKLSGRGGSYRNTGNYYDGSHPPGVRPRDGT